MHPARLRGLELAAVRRRPVFHRFTRYAAGSAVAFATSECVFLLLYGVRGSSPKTASAIAFAVGIPVNYVLNRRWAWKRRGRPDVRNEVLPYVSVVALSIAATALATTLMDRWLEGRDLPRVADVLLVAGTYAVVNLSLFLAKFVALDRFAFRRRPKRSRLAPDAEPVP